MSTSTATSDDQSTRTARASDRLWSALCAHPGSTSEQLAVHAGIGQSTAGKILARWVADATVTRHERSNGKRRGPATFTAADAAQPSEPSTTDATDATDAIDADVPRHVEAVADRAEAPATDADTVGEQVGRSATTNPGPVDGTAPAIGKQARLAPGGLRGIVEDYLREHPQESFGPAAIGRHLTRSSGAVANALDRLVADGYAIMTSPKPKRYAIAKAAETS